MTGVVVERIDLAQLPAGTPEGWYPDPVTPHLIRFWDGGSWTDLCYVAPARDADGRIREYHPLSRGDRPSHWRTFGIFVLYLVPPTALSLFANALVDWPSVSGSYSNVSTTLIYVVYFAALARRVDYRWFDTFFQLIPIYGFIWIVIIVWRNAKLPYRNWRPREEVLLADPAFAQALAAAPSLRSTGSGVVEGDAERP